MLLFNQVLMSPSVYNVSINCELLQQFESCRLNSVSNYESLVGCLIQGPSPVARMKRDENVMEKIVGAYANLFGSHSKTQSK